FAPMSVVRGPCSHARSAPPVANEHQHTLGPRARTRKRKGARNTGSGWGSGSFDTGAASTRRILGAAETAHDEVVARRLVDAVHRAESGARVVEGAAAQDVLALRRDGVRAGEALALRATELREHLERLRARRLLAACGAVALIRKRIVDVVDPLPH